MFWLAGVAPALEVKVSEAGLGVIEGSELTVNVTPTGIVAPPVGVTLTVPV
jgi:hypothetical protein